MSDPVSPRSNTWTSVPFETSSIKSFDNTPAGFFRHLRAAFGVSKKDGLNSYSSLPLVQQRPSYEISSITPVGSGELTETDFIIALMGPTGVGKSTFIQIATGQDSQHSGVGHGLESYTSGVAALRISFSDNINVVLVDTPGFDDTYLSDLEILKVIANWLRDASQYELCGILYLHRVSDNRMSGTPLKNLTMFQKLCGEDCFGKVILVTTMWPEEGSADEQLCITREEELKHDYWAGMIANGSTTLRFKNTQESSWSIIDHLITTESKKQWILIQEELVNQRKKLIGTEAGQQLHGLTGELVERQADLLKRMTEELRRTDDPAILQALLSELSELRKERKKAKRDLRQLDISIVGTLRRFANTLRLQNPAKPGNSRNSKRKSIVDMANKDTGDGDRKGNDSTTEDHGGGRDSGGNGDDEGRNNSGHGSHGDDSNGDSGSKNNAHEGSVDIGGRDGSGKVGGGSGGNEGKGSGNYGNYGNYDSYGSGGSGGSGKGNGINVHNSDDSNGGRDNGATPDDNPTPQESQDGTRAAAWRLIGKILSNKSAYQTLLGSTGSKARIALDILQKLLDSQDVPKELRRGVLCATMRLCAASGVYPQCLELRGISYGDRPVTSGGFGDIWKGYHRAHPICLKVARVYVNTEIEQLLKGYAREAIVWSQLSHPNVLPFYGIYYLEKPAGHLGLVSPWMQNGNVNQYLRSNPEAPRLPLVHELLAGLIYLHEHSIVHGDLKGANLLISPDGSACLADFGLSCVADPDVLRRTSLKSLTKTDSTVRWEAPELMDEVENKPLPRPTFLSDIYSVASVMYEILTGRIPFYDTRKNETVMSWVLDRKRPSKPSSEEPLEFSDEIWAVMQKCWDHTPDKRPKARQVAELLREIPQPELTTNRTTRQSLRERGENHKENELLLASSFRDAMRGQLSFSEEEIDLLKEYENVI